MTDLVLVDCYLPESQVTQGYFSETDEGTAASGLTISISNDGEHKSEENLTFISFDSACMSCNISSGCLFKGSVHYLTKSKNEIASLTVLRGPTGTNTKLKKKIKIKT